MQKEARQKWIDALRSGKYKQGRGRMRSMNDAFCCLGVLCDVIKPEDWKMVGHDDHRGDERWTHGGHWDAAAPSRQLCDEIDLSYSWLGRLIHLNDNDKKSFDYIADIIEQEVPIES